MEQVGDLFRIFDIGFASGDVFDMLGIDDQNFQVFHFQEVINGFTAGAGAFHGHMGASISDDPIGHLNQVLGHGGEGFYFLSFRSENAGDDILFVDIETTDVTVDDLHRRWTFLCVKNGKDWRNGQRRANLSRVLPEGATICGTPGRWGPSKSRAGGTKVKRPPFAGLTLIIQTTSHFHHLMVPQKRHGG